jgi:hypothetical protein
MAVMRTIGRTGTGPDGIVEEWLMRTAVCLKGLEKQSSPNSTAEHTNTPRMLMEDRTHEWSDRPNYPPFALMQAKTDSKSLPPLRT